MITKLGHIRDWTGDNEVYIGRAGHGFDGYFGNPCIKNRVCPVCTKVHDTTKQLIKCFEVYARARIKTDNEYKQKVKELKGKTLMCFCYPNKACHGSVLIRLTEELNKKGRLF